MLISKHFILVLVVTLALASLAQSTHDDGVRCEGDLISYYVVGDQASESCMASCENNSECVAYGISSDGICVDFDWDYGGYADCSWYEDESKTNFYDDPGCPVWGDDVGSDGVTAWEACCYCGGGYNPYDDDDYSFSYGYDDEDYCVDFDWVGYADGADCSWYEDESISDYIDDPGCPEHGHDEDAYGVTAWDACCYCGGGSNPYDDDDYSFSYSYSFSYGYDDDYYSFSYDYDDDDLCVDFDDWVNWAGTDCSSFQVADDPGCPVWGGDESEDGVTAWEACCYCGGGSNPYDDYSRSHSYSFSYGYDDDYYSYDYDDDDICVDFDWVYETGDSGCSAYENDCVGCYTDAPGCPEYGSDESEDGVTAWEACCYCGGGYNPYDDDLTPILYCSLYRDFRGFTDGNNGEECNVLSTSPPSFVPSVAPSVSLSLAPTKHPTHHGKAKKEKKKKKEKKPKGRRRTF